MKKYYRSLLASATLAMMTTACSDSSSSSSTLTGQLMYSGLSNLTYKTATQEGKLDDAGTFKYLEGETVSFRWAIFSWWRMCPPESIFRFGIWRG